MTFFSDFLLPFLKGNKPKKYLSIVGLKDGKKIERFQKNLKKGIFYDIISL